jgi:hypothetical protein
LRGVLNAGLVVGSERNLVMYNVSPPNSYPPPVTYANTWLQDLEKARDLAQSFRDSSGVPPGYHAFDPELAALQSLRPNQSQADWRTTAQQLAEKVISDANAVSQRFAQERANNTLTGRIGAYVRTAEVHRDILAAISPHYVVNDVKAWMKYLVGFIEANSAAHNMWKLQHRAANPNQMHRANAIAAMQRQARVIENLVADPAHRPQIPFWSADRQGGVPRVLEYPPHDMHPRSSANYAEPNYLPSGLPPQGNSSHFYSAGSSTSQYYPTVQPTPFLPPPSQHSFLPSSGPSTSQQSFFGPPASSSGHRHGYGRHPS